KDSDLVFLEEELFKGADCTHYGIVVPQHAIWIATGFQSFVDATHIPIAQAIPQKPKSFISHELTHVSRNHSVLSAHLGNVVDIVVIGNHDSFISKFQLSINTTVNLVDDDERSEFH